MAVIHGRYGPTHPRLGALAARIAHPLLRRYAARYGFHTPDSAYARERGAYLSPQSCDAASVSIWPASDLRAITAAWH